MVTQRDLVGTWKLVSLEVRTKDNNAIIDPRFPGSTGLFLWGTSRAACRSTQRTGTSPRP